MYQQRQQYHIGTLMQGIFLEVHKSFQFGEDPGMPFFYDRLKQHLESLDPKRNYNQLQFPAGIQSGVFSTWKKPKGHPAARRPSDTDIEKLASVEWLGLSQEQLKAWRRLDDMSNDDLITLIKEAYPDDKERKRFIKEVLGL